MIKSGVNVFLIGTESFVNAFLFGTTISGFKIRKERVNRFVEHIYSFKKLHKCKEFPVRLV